MTVAKQQPKPLNRLEAAKRVLAPGQAEEPFWLSLYNFRFLQAQLRAAAPRGYADTHRQAVLRGGCGSSRTRGAGRRCSPPGAECLCNGEPLEIMRNIPNSGGIGLQAEDGKFEFRHVRVKELE